MKILYDSSAVHDAIKKVLTKKSERDRRVAVVAYIGDAAEAFLPHPDELEIICCLQAGSTSADALERLRKRGAKLFHSLGLHMKVYWSSANGCVIGSANASASALTKGGLREAAVFLEPGDVDIDRIIRSVDAKQISRSDILKLHRETDRLAPSLGRTHSRSRTKAVSFGDWLVGTQKPWKLGWWTEPGDTAKSAKKEARLRFGSPAVHDDMNFSGDQYKPGDWILCFQLGKKNLMKPHWLYADFVVKVERGDRGAYERDYPMQAVQVHKESLYPYPPFDVGTPKFHVALSRAIEKFGEGRIELLTSMVVPKRFQDLLAEHWNNLG